MGMFTYLEKYYSCNFIFDLIRIPLPQENRDWPSYFTINDKTISPYYEFSHDQHRKTEPFQFNLKNEKCDTLWNIDKSSSIEDDTGNIFTSITQKIWETLWY